MEAVYPSFCLSMVFWNLEWGSVEKGRGTHQGRVKRNLGGGTCLNFPVKDT